MYVKHLHDGICILAGRRLPCFPKRTVTHLPKASRQVAQAKDARSRLTLRLGDECSMTKNLVGEQPEVEPELQVGGDICAAQVLLRACY